MRSSGCTRVSVCVCVCTHTVQALCKTKQRAMQSERWWWDRVKQGACDHRLLCVCFGSAAGTGLCCLSFPLSSFFDHGIILWFLDDMLC